MLQEPLPLHDTNEIQDALLEGSSCLQIDPLYSLEDITGDEDCLFLNVYTPSVSILLDIYYGYDSW